MFQKVMDKIETIRVFPVRPLSDREIAALDTVLLEGVSPEGLDFLEACEITEGLLVESNA